jgi:hypothetical protein
MLLFHSGFFPHNPRVTRFSEVNLKDSTNNIPRRGVLNGAGSMLTTAALKPHAALAKEVFEVAGANAFLPRNLDGINQYLTKKGFAPFEALPDGFRPLMLLIGTEPPANLDGVKTLARNFKGTLLVRFPHPNTWIVGAPKIDANAESGQIQASDNYAATAATFFAEALPDGVTSLESVGTEFLGGAISNVFRNGIVDLKITNKKTFKTDDGQDMLTFNFAYTLITQQSLEIEIEGNAGCFVKGGALAGVQVNYNARKAKKFAAIAAYITHTKASCGSDRLCW